MKKLNIEYIDIKELKPYKNNPRKNDAAVDIVAKSIKEFGFRNPIILDENNEIVAGHTRYEASKKLKLKEVPVLRVTDLTKEQIKAFRIMDNKSQDYSQWDYDFLKKEILDLKELNYDLDFTGFDENEINFFNPDTDGPANNAYLEWRKNGTIAYGNEDNTGYKTILLHFKAEEDVREFSKLINQTITDRTKYLWYPKQEEDKVGDLQYEEKK